MRGIVKEEPIPHFYSVPGSWRVRQFPVFLGSPEPIGQLIHDFRPVGFPPAMVPGVSKFDEDQRREDMDEEKSEYFLDGSPIEELDKTMKRDAKVSNSHPTTSPHSILHPNPKTASLETENSLVVPTDHGETHATNEESLLNVVGTIQHPFTPELDERKKRSFSFNEDESAKRIQSAYRGFSVRKAEPLKHLRTLAEIREQVTELESELQSPEAILKFKTNKKEKIRISETLMSLLLRLDTIQCSNSSVRSARKEMAKQIVKIQDSLEALQSDMEACPNEVTRSVSRTTETHREPFSQPTALSEASPNPSCLSEDLAQEQEAPSQGSTSDENSTPGNSNPSNDSSSTTIQSHGDPSRVASNVVINVPVEKEAEDSWVTKVHHSSSPTNKSPNSELSPSEENRKERSLPSSLPIRRNPSSDHVSREEDPCSNSAEKSLSPYINKFCVPQVGDPRDACGSPRAPGHPLSAKDSGFSRWESVAASLAEENKNLEEMVRKQLEIHARQTDLIHQLWTRIHSFEQALRSLSRRNDYDVHDLMDYWKEKPSRGNHQPPSPAWDDSRGKENLDLGHSLLSKLKPHSNWILVPDEHEEGSLPLLPCHSRRASRYVPAPKFAKPVNGFGHPMDSYDRPVYYLV